MVYDGLRVKKAASLLPQIAIGELWPRGARNSSSGQRQAGRRTEVPIQKLRLWAGWARSGLAPEGVWQHVGSGRPGGKGRVLVVTVTGGMGEKTGIEWLSVGHGHCRDLSCPKCWLNPS